MLFMCFCLQRDYYKSKLLSKIAMLFSEDVTQKNMYRIVIADCISSNIGNFDLAPVENTYIFAAIGFSISFISISRCQKRGE